MSVEEKRLILRDKVEEGKRRIAERDLAADAQEAVDQAASFVSKHPFALLAGALAIGLLLGGRGKKKAVTAARPAKKTNVVVALLAEAAIAHGLKLVDKAKKDAAKKV